MNSKREEMRKASDQISSSVEKDIGNDYEKLAQEILIKKAIPKNAVGASDAMVEGIYGQAYRLYNTGKYKDAIELFRLLIMLNPTESKFTLGLAACFHMMKEYDKAISTYALCSVVDGNSPIPHYHASDCYIQMKDPLSAIVSLELAIKRAGEKPEYQALKSRAQMMIESLKKEKEENVNKG